MLQTECMLIVRIILVSPKNINDDQLTADVCSILVGPNTSVMTK